METEVGTCVKKRVTLRSLCVSNGWSYAIYWRSNLNLMLLSMEDSYYEEDVGAVDTNTMIMIGEGEIGGAAVDGMQRWVFLDTTSSGSSEFAHQCVSGIKTVAVVPVESRGVLQFGSTQQILETPEFLNQATQFLLHQHNFDPVVPSPASSSFPYLNQNSFYAPPPPPTSKSCAKDEFEPLPESWLDDLSLSQCLPHTSTMLSAHLPSMPSQTHLFQTSNSFGEANTTWHDDTLFYDFGDENLGEDTVKPVGDQGFGFSLPILRGFSISDCISGNQTGSVAGLFSQLGLDHLFTEAGCTNSTTTTCIHDEWSARTRKVETNQTIHNPIQFNSHSLGVKLMGLASSGGSKECTPNPKSQAGLWMDDSHTKDAKSCISGVSTQTRMPEEPIKATKKRARPGESTRPRPKDRQMIADRIKELRDIVPNGSKLSIDALLGRTIKHMLFMQSLAKHADRLKNVDEPKLIGHDNGLARSGGSSTSLGPDGTSNRGATWAYEVGGTNLYCPIIVEDLTQPGQMLIEMLCEERGYFLEIADIVRGFGLTILKGVMEAKDDKIWAHFVVEGKRHVTRMDVFVSLMQFLQGTGLSEINTGTVDPDKVVNNGNPLWSNYKYQQQLVAVPLPI